MVFEAKQKNPPVKVRDAEFDPWIEKILCRRKWQLTTVFCLGNPMDKGPGGLQSLGLQRVIHNLTAKQ